MGKPIYTFYKDSDWINEKCIEYIYFDENNKYQLLENLLFYFNFSIFTIKQFTHFNISYLQKVFEFENLPLNDK